MRDGARERIRSRLARDINKNEFSPDRLWLLELHLACATSNDRVAQAPQKAMASRAALARTLAGRTKDQEKQPLAGRERATRSGSLARKQITLRVESGHGTNPQFDSMAVGGPLERHWMCIASYRRASGGGQNRTHPMSPAGFAPPVRRHPQGDASPGQSGRICHCFDLRCTTSAREIIPPLYLHL